MQKATNKVLQPILQECGLARASPTGRLVPALQATIAGATNSICGGILNEGVLESEPRGRMTAVRSGVNMFTSSQAALHLTGLVNPFVKMSAACLSVVS